MLKTVRFKYVERNLLIRLNGEAFIDSRQHIDPHDLVYSEHKYLLIVKAQFRDNKKTARIKIDTEKFKGTVDVPVAEFNKFPILEITIKYDEQSTSKSDN